MLSRVKRKKIISKLENTIKDMNALANEWEDEDKQRGESWNKTLIRTARMTAAILGAWLESENELLALEDGIRRTGPKKRTH